MLIINDKIQNDGIIYFDKGFTFGKGLFETIYIKRKPVLLREHLDRLNNGLTKLGIRKNISEEYVLKNIDKMGFKNCVLKIIVSDENVIFESRDVNYNKKDYERGFSLKVSNFKRNPYSFMTYMKSLNYYDNIIAREKVTALGYDECLFLNTEEYVSEGSISNVFFTKDNIVYTPEVGCGILDGIIRGFILNKVKNYKIIEGKFRLNELMNADSVFITNSVIGIMKVKSIDDKILNINDIFYEIKRIYDEYIQKNY